MQLSREQIQTFRGLHKHHELDDYNDDEIREIATGVADVYLTLYRIGQRICQERKQDDSVLPDSATAL